METSIAELEEVIVTGNPDQNVKSTTVGKNELSIETIKKLPLFAGQVDVIKSLTLLPGVTSVGEVSSGLNVRGGQSDNNLVLLGGAPIYNPSHLFGFFSAINGEVVSNVSLYKGGIPARFGGRSSSVLDISTKVGDFEEWGGQATVGMASSSAMVEGPILEKKLSFSAGGRASYVGWLLNQSDDADINSSQASFYDVNTTFSYKPSEKSKIDFRTYYSFDDFQSISDTVISWTNFNNALNWDHVFGTDKYLNVNLSNSNYTYSISNSPGPLGFSIDSRISDTRLNADLLIEYDEKKSIDFGVNATFMELTPGELTPSEGSTLNEQLLSEERGLELAGFFEYKNALTDNIAIEAGLRYNHYLFLGPGTSNVYIEGLPLSESTIIGEENFANNEVIQSYNALNPRLGLRYSFSEDLSIKAGVNRLSQYINLISNTATIAPTDTWKLSDSFIEPNEAWIFSLGVFKNFGKKYEVSLESYYKPIVNVIEYKDGADLVLNDNLETELLNGEGLAYGSEFYLRKFGRLSGWLSYTYSRTKRKVESGFQSESINNGAWFPSNFDTPHNLSITANYLIKKTVEFSSTFIYSDGRPTTYPEGKFEYLGETVAFFNERNRFRIPSYHRLDVSMTWDWESKSKWLSGDFTISIYNLYGRRNAFSVYFDDVFAQEPQAFKLSILGSAFPSVSYRLEF